MQHAVFHQWKSALLCAFSRPCSRPSLPRGSRIKKQSNSVISLYSVWVVPSSHDDILLISEALPIAAATRSNSLALVLPDAGSHRKDSIVRSAASCLPVGPSLIPQGAIHAACRALPPVLVHCATSHKRSLFSPGAVLLILLKRGRDLFLASRTALP